MSEFFLSFYFFILFEKLHFATSDLLLFFTLVAQRFRRGGDKNRPRITILTYPKKSPPYGLYTYVLKESMSLHYQYLSPWWGLSCWAPIIFFQSPDGLGCGPIMKCVQDGYLEQMDPASLGEKKSEPELEPEPEPTTPTEPAEEPTTTEEPPSFSLVNPLEMGTVDGEGDT